MPKPTAWDWIPNDLQKLFRPMRKGLWLVGGAAMTYDRAAHTPIHGPTADWDFAYDYRCTFQRAHAALFVSPKPKRVHWELGVLGCWKGTLSGYRLDVFEQRDIGTYLSTLPYPRHGIAIELATNMTLTTGEYRDYHTCNLDEVITTRPVFDPHINSKNVGDMIDREPFQQF